MAAIGTVKEERMSVSANASVHGVSERRRWVEGHTVSVRKGDLKASTAG